MNLKSISAGLGIWLLTVGMSLAAVTYRVDFRGTWSAATHPGAFPGSAHFTDLVGGVHSDAVSFWEPGGFATPGVEQMAETGVTSLMFNEVQAAVNAGTARSTLLGSDLFNLPNETSLTFTADETHSLLTLTTMVAPSPDWFVGVSGLSLRENGNWRGRIELVLDTYDAGTEEGTGLSLSNPATSPHEPIAKLNEGPLVDLPPLATLTLTLQPNGLTADFNQDGFVNESDTSVWANGYGNFADGSATIVDGDADGDGHVTGQDFLLWQENFGRSLGGTGFLVTTVPEPGTALIMALGLLATLVGRNR